MPRVLQLNEAPGNVGHHPRVGAIPCIDHGLQYAYARAGTAGRVGFAEVVPVSVAAFQADIRVTKLRNGPGHVREYQTSAPCREREPQPAQTPNAHRAANLSVWLPCLSESQEFDPFGTVLKE